MVLNITFQLISDATAGKLIPVFDTAVSVTILYFPLVYIISDIVTEVYGYAVARQILWYTVLASVIAGITYQFAVALPSPDFFEETLAYKAVFDVVPRILVGGWLAVFAGDITNNFILSKMKIWTNGKHLWARTIGSTIAGQFVNTAVFFTIGLWGILPLEQLLPAILVGWGIKTAIEALMTPVTYTIVNKVKEIEKIDHFDTGTNFNPFKFSSEQPKRDINHAQN